jgi:hypothetical protein
MALNNQDRVHQGIEFGAEGKLSSTLKAVGVVSFGNYRYTSRPEATINYDNGTAEDVTETIYAKNFYLGGTPQFASSLGLRFNKNYWFIDVNGNYYDKICVTLTTSRSQSGIAYLPRAPLINHQLSTPTDGGSRWMPPSKSIGSIHTSSTSTPRPVITSTTRTLPWRIRKNRFDSPTLTEFVSINSA